MERTHASAVSARFEAPPHHGGRRLDPIDVIRVPTLVHAGETTTPIEHVVVIVGENRSFDHLFATYVPRRGETVWNLLSKGIITAEGTQGPHFGLAKQYQGVLKAPSKFSLVPTSKSLSTFPPLAGQAVNPTAPTAVTNSGAVQQTAAITATTPAAIRLRSFMAIASLPNKPLFNICPMSR
jgi:hypothetical protein